MSIFVITKGKGYKKASQCNALIGLSKLFRYNKNGFKASHLYLIKVQISWR